MDEMFIAKDVYEDEEWTITKYDERDYRVMDDTCCVAMYRTLEDALGSLAKVECYDGTRASKCECVKCYDGRWCLEEDAVYVDSKCGYAPCDETVEDYDGDYQMLSDCREVYLHGYGKKYITYWDLDDLWHYCEYCEEWVCDDDWNYEQERCERCAEPDESGVIDSYHSHHKDVWYGEPDKDGDYKGLGFELEIDKNPESESPMGRFNQEFAESLMYNCGLDEDECVFETDGSLDTGFEIISMPHTVEDFWSKRKNWAKMLEECRTAGFKSHDAGNCGLHVHVSVEMFGKDEHEINQNIGKVHRFYEQYWGDLVRASRRRRFDYCSKNPVEDVNGRTLTPKMSVRAWQGVRRGSHGMALNDRYGRPTLEFRLGRGTLNKSSFFAWIDLCLTMVRNSRKSSKKLEDAAEWLDGIQLTTAQYLVSRNAFVDAIRRTMPEAFWVFDQNDCQENEAA